MSAVSRESASDGSGSYVARTDEIRARLDAATDGPWFASGELVLRQEVRHHPGFGEREDLVWTAEGTTEADADLIAHAPDDIAYLLAEVVRLRTALREADEVFSGYTMASVTYDVDRMRLIVRAALGEDE